MIQRVDLNRTGFDILFSDYVHEGPMRTGSDTRAARIRVDGMAIGRTRGEDDRYVIQALRPISFLAEFP